jgi:hypothetical protein
MRPSYGAHESFDPTVSFRASALAEVPLCEVPCNNRPYRYLEMVS